MHKLPKSAVLVLELLEQEDAMTPKQLVAGLDIAPRTISFGLRKLMKAGLVRKEPNLEDMRQPFYMIPGIRKSWKLPRRDVKTAEMAPPLPEYNLKEALAHLIEYDDVVENHI
jgi:DNA-binding transcriptional ArsR family regulator